MLKTTRFSTPSDANRPEKMDDADKRVPLKEIIKDARKAASFVSRRTKRFTALLDSEDVAEAKAALDEAGVDHLDLRSELRLGFSEPMTRESAVRQLRDLAQIVQDALRLAGTDISERDAEIAAALALVSVLHSVDRTQERMALAINRVLTSAWRFVLGRGPVPHTWLVAAPRGGLAGPPAILIERLGESGEASDIIARAGSIGAP